MKTRMKPLLPFVFALSLCCAACSPSTRVQAQRPAQVALSGVRRIAVPKFEGRFAEAARQCFLNTIYDSDRFAVVPGEQAQAVVLVSIQSNLCQSRGTDEVRQETTRQRTVTVRDADGQVVRSYTEDIPVERIIQHPYVQRHADTEAQLRVMQNSRTLARTDATLSQDRRYGGKDCLDRESCPEGQLPLTDLPSAHKTLSELACAAGSELASRLLPVSYEIRIPLDDDADAQVARGAELADDGQWSAAMALWQQSLDADPHNAPALYNMGVARERGGTLEDLRQAQTYYTRAAALEPRENYLEARQRIHKRIQEARELDRRRGN
jgi:tetratricopeptide (TPR) repeat protein